MINSPTKVVGFAQNPHEHLVQVPLPLRPCTKLLGSFPSDLGCEDRTKTVPPEPNCFVADVDAALVKQILELRSDRGKRTYSITASGTGSAISAFLSLMVHLTGYRRPEHSHQLSVRCVQFCNGVVFCLGARNCGVLSTF